MKNQDISIIGSTASLSVPFDADTIVEKELDSQFEEFRDFIWGDKGYFNRFANLSPNSFGKDIELILFQFEVFPDDSLIDQLPNIERYRPKEKAIGIPVIITHNNFIDNKENEKQDFMRKTILEKIDLLADIVAKKKLDTDMLKLRTKLLDLT